MALREWVPGRDDLLLIAVVIVVVILGIWEARRHARTDAESAEKGAPFALRDLDLTPEAAKELAQHLENPSALPSRPLRSVAVAPGVDSIG